MLKIETGNGDIAFGYEERDGVPTLVVYKLLESFNVSLKLLYCGPFCWEFFWQSAALGPVCSFIIPSAKICPK